MRKHWLLFSQTVTIALALLFIIHTLKPELLPTAARSGVVTLYENTTPETANKMPANGLSAAAKKAMPTVVNIFTSTVIKSTGNPFIDDPRFKFFFGEQLDAEPQNNSSLGSGVIVSSDGYILTNHHVVEAADEIEVALPDGKKLLAKVVGNDPETDLAVLRVNGDKLPAITFGQSEALRVGDVVLAIGNPFGVGQTVTSGIVSALGRSGLHINTFENFIQTDAAINPGNSGGALVDASGSLVGINTAIYSRSGGSMGIGFAIPAATAKMVMEQIIRSGSVTRGWIGVEVQEITPALAESFKLPEARGAIIAGVLRGGPADKAGVKPGDVLTTINGAPVTDPQGMLNLVAALQPGTSAQMKLRRQAKAFDVAITVGRRPKPQARE